MYLKQHNYYQCYESGKFSSNWCFWSIIFILKIDLLQTHIILEKLKNWMPLTYLVNWTSGKPLVTKPNYIPTNMNTEKIVLNFNQLYFYFLFQYLPVMHHRRVNSKVNQVFTSAGPLQKRMFECGMLDLFSSNY